MAFAPVAFGPKLAEGKTKIIYAHPSKEHVVYVFHKDGITAGDGARRSELPGKGALACRTTSNVFYLLESQDIDTHYIGMVGENINIVAKCAMIPLEVVMRRIATGSYLKRHPEISEGTRFDPVMVELFYKDDANHDPLVTDEQIKAMQLATQEEIDEMRAIGRHVFEALEEAWAALDVTLVDCKIEFGRATENGQLLVADVIDNDSWRIWPGGDKNRMLDKQIYRNLPEVTDQALKDLLEKYATVAQLTESFVDED
jgi:phosphoribosylaminoimidazole-succinocarboxamide synthase